MSIVREEKKLNRLHKVAAAAALLIVGAITSGCSHPVATPPAVPPAPSAAAPGVAPAPGAMAPSTAVASPMSPGDQQEMKQKQDENKGQAAPP